MLAYSSSNSSMSCPKAVEIFTSFFIVYLLLLLPLFLLVLYMGFQRRRKSLMSHSDVFTFHMVSLELMSVLGSCFFCYGLYTAQVVLLSVGVGFFFMVTPGQTLFHLLTCVERYLAVVHPVTYRGLRQESGVRIRNICIGCVWLICLESVGLGWLGSSYIIFNCILVSFSSAAVCFCSLCVLRALIRPGPGEVGRRRERVDQSKQRAFHTVTAILGALLLKFLTFLVSNTLVFSPLMSNCDRFVFSWSLALFSLPSSLVLPLLFLHRAGKLPGCTYTTE